MLKQDLERFNEFFEAKKLACRLAIKRAEEQHKLNVGKNKKIKELVETKAHLKSWNVKCLETLTKYFKQKVFLDELTDKKDLEALQLKQRARKKNKRQKKSSSHKIDF